MRWSKCHCCPCEGNCYCNIPYLAKQIDRFVNRVHRFGDAYFYKHLTGPQLAWASKRYHGHRVFPESIFDEMKAAGIY
ncbi:hypothetical protein GGX14DRAFT_361343 [Mycena pura]|uniref:Uncharacterized protein n=1 Tax=Mycena pura TaxID=153505 RepID=A0AAD6VHP5_9AGAR|nr:hypothetical protein GGX14DRAFT_361343 [Mycena pura]